MTIDDQWIAEDLLAMELAVTRAVLRSHRPAAFDGEVQHKGNRVLWQKTAAARVAAKLGVTWPIPQKTAPPGQPDAAPALPDVIETLTVISGPRFADGRHFANGHVIQATRANGERVNVRVNCPQKFVPRGPDGSPMQFEARLVRAFGYWQLTGREPRYVGRW